MDLDRALETLYNREKLTEKEVKELCERVSVKRENWNLVVVTTLSCHNILSLLLLPPPLCVCYSLSYLLVTTFSHLLPPLRLLFLLYHLLIPFLTGQGNSYRREQCTGC
jgi:hypothetical protein